MAKTFRSALFIFILQGFLAISPGVIAAEAIPDTWEEVTPSAPWTARSGHAVAVFDDKLWLFGGAITQQTRLNDIWVTEDGINWDLVTDDAEWAPRMSHTVVVHNGALWLMGGEDGPNFNDVWTSEDGETWTLVVEHAAWPPTRRHASVSFDGSLWMLGGNADTGRTSKVYRSEDGAEWSLVGTAAWASRSNHTATVHDGSIWVSGGSGLSSGVLDLWRSADGLAWSKVTTPTSIYNRASHTSESWQGQFLVIGGVGTSLGGYLSEVVYAPDVDGWAQPETQVSPWQGRSDLATAIWNDRIWVVGGFRKTNGSDVFFNDVWATGGTFSEGQVEAEGSVEAEVIEGEAEVEEGEGIVDPLDGEVEEGEGEIGEGEGIVDPVDGEVEEGEITEGEDEVVSLVWQEVVDEAAWSRRSGHEILVFDNKLWLLGGAISQTQRLNDVWVSEDGVSWTLVTDSAAWLPRLSHTAVVHDGAMWVMGGEDGTIYNDVWYSTDGLDWTMATEHAAWEPTRRHASVSFDGSLWVIAGNGQSGGRNSKIYRSDDGAEWSLVAQGEFPARSNHTVTIHDGAMWLSGGSGTSVRGLFGLPVSSITRFDVWRSVDGTTWEFVTDQLAGPKRASHSAESWRGRYWAFGGVVTDIGYDKSLVYTEDGTAWDSPNPVEAPWEGRSDLASAVWNDRLWVVGGFRKDSSVDKFFNDVWVTPPLDSMEGEAETGTEAEISEDTVITIDRVIDGPNGRYTPGQPLDIVVEFKREGDGTAKPLTLSEALPEGWTFIGVVGGPRPPLAPSAGDASPFTFEWPEVWDFSYNLIYRVFVPLETEGLQIITGRAVYTIDDELRSTPILHTCVEANPPLEEPYEGEGGVEAEVIAEGEPEGWEDAPAHSLDADGNGSIGLNELLRAVQLFNAGEIACSSPLAMSEDGFEIGPGRQSCRHHSADYQPQDWEISFSELLRQIQFYNFGGAYPCEGTEDGFCAGTK